MRKYKGVLTHDGAGVAFPNAVIHGGDVFTVEIKAELDRDTLYCKKLNYATLKVKHGGVV